MAALQLSPSKTVAAVCGQQRVPGALQCRSLGCGPCYTLFLRHPLVSAARHPPCTTHWDGRPLARASPQRSTQQSCFPPVQSKGKESWDKFAPYKPADFDADGRYRSIEISALKKDLQVRARKGYFAPQQ